MSAADVPADAAPVRPGAPRQRGWIGGPCPPLSVEPVRAFDTATISARIDSAVSNGVRMLRAMRRKGNLGTREMAVLALVDEGPTHGYAVAGLLAEDGDLGRIWSLGRPLTYRTIDRLRDDKLIADGGVEVGQSAPDRKLLQTTAAGREAVAQWLATPEPRIREFRPALLYKLELLRRRGADRRPLLRAQRDLVAGRTTAAPPDGPAAVDGVDELLREWRSSQHVIAVAFLDRLLDAAAGDASDGVAG